MSKNKSVTLAIALSFLIVSLFVSMQLVRMSQETRRQAAGTMEAKVKMDPPSYSFTKVGNETSFDLIVNTNKTQFDGVQFLKNICFDPNYLEFVSIAYLPENGMDKSYEEIEMVGSKKCLNLVFEPTDREKPPYKSVSSVEAIVLAKIKFKALRVVKEDQIVVSTAKVNWKGSTNEGLLVSGVGGTFTFTSTSVTGVSYEIKDEGGTGGKRFKRKSPLDCNKTTGKIACDEVTAGTGDYATLTDCETDSTCFIHYTHGTGDCDTATGDWKCKIDAAGVWGKTDCEASSGCDTTNKFKRGACNTTVGKYDCKEDSSGTFSGKSECENDPATCKVDLKARWKRGTCDTSLGKYNCARNDETGEYNNLDSCEAGDSYCVKTPGGATNTPTPTATPTPPGGATNTPTPTATPTPPGGATNTPTPTSTPVPGSGGYVLKFKMIYPGIAKGTSTDECSKDLLPVDITVMAMLDIGATKTITINGVNLTKTTDTVLREDEGEKSNVYVYKGQLILPDSFPYSSKLAIFINAKKHLTIKYGKDNQTGLYKGYDGTLSGLTKDAASTPEFNFTGYPLMAGDITGDDVVNIQDYAELKAAMNSKDILSSAADLNGDCIVNSFDSTYFFASLKLKEGQTY